MSIGNKEKGYTMFMINDDDADKERYKYYRDEILIPFIQSTRNKYDGFFNEYNLPIPEDLTAASWCDGDIAQVASIVDDLEIFNKNKIIANKHSASRTGVEQAADTSKVFHMLENLEDTYTVSDLTVDRCPMKKNCSAGICEITRRAKIGFKANKKKSLIYFVASIPLMVRKAATRDNIQHRFIANGLVDETYKRYPDLNKILATCRKNPKTDDYNRCIQSFPYLFNHCLEHGHVPYFEFESLEFHQDINIQGNCVQRDYTIKESK